MSRPNDNLAARERIFLHIVNGNDNRSSGVTARYNHSKGAIIGVNMDNMCEVVRFMRIARTQG